MFTGGSHISSKLGNIPANPSTNSAGHHGSIGGLSTQVGAFGGVSSTLTTRQTGAVMLTEKHEAGSIWKLQASTERYHEIMGDDTPSTLSMNSASRRSFFAAAFATTAAVATIPLQSAWAEEGESAIAIKPKVLVLGGTGLVGSEVVKQLRAKGVDVVATSRNGRDGTIALDVAAGGDVAAAVAGLAKGCTAVISTIGTINTPQDEVVNAASGLAAKGAKQAGVSHFVYISNAPEVRSSMGGLDFLKGYMAGKISSENAIKSSFGSAGGDSSSSYMLIQPTFIFGGDKFEVNPPRVANGYGKLVEGLLSTGPFRLAADVLPGFAGLALEPPVSAADVAGAAIAGALASKSSVLDTHDKIVEASKKAQ
jgi:uncharacterized protein YbjT (DUF2867 family)